MGNSALLEQLGVCAREMQADRCDAAPLRALQLTLRDELRSNLATSSQLWVVVVDQFLERVFYNLVGDVPYKGPVTDEIRSAFYLSVGKALGGLHTAVSTNDQQKEYTALSSLGGAYWKAVHDFNSK